MTRIDIASELVEVTAAAATQFARIRAMRDIVGAIGASHYVILDPAGEGAGHPGIVASNWSFDAIALVGLDALSRICAAARQRPGPACGPGPLDRFDDVLDLQERSALRDQGHLELLHLRLNIGSDIFSALFTARAQGCIDTTMIERAGLLMSYLVSARIAGRPARPSDTLSERERECLFWVAEGKTTEEVALILSVSSNTVNTYIANAIQKLSATNRAMAIAAAIRQGFI